MNNLLYILKGCKAKDPKSQRQLYEAYYGYGLKVMFRYIYHYEKAVDLTNDGFVKLFRTFERFDVSNERDCEKMLFGYIKRIMINNAIDELRKEKMSPEIGRIADSSWDIENDEQGAEGKILYKELILLIKNLPPKCRAVFNLYVIDGYNHLEIADLLNIAVGTSKSSLSRARVLLQQSIKNLEETYVC